MTRSIIVYFSFLIFISCMQEVPVSDAYGNFEATTVTVGSEANGKLIYFSLEEGDKLKAGKLVAIVDTTQLHLSKKQLQSTIGILPEKLRNSIADIGVLQNQKNNLIRERDRVARLIEKKAATPKQLDDLNGQIDVVDQQMIALRSQTTTVNKGILAEKEPIMAQIALINEQIRKCYIRNPVDGTVLSKLAENYEMVAMGSPLYRIGQLDTMTLRFYVDAVQLQELRLGQGIQVLIDKGIGGYVDMTGKISWISSESEFTPKTIQTKADRVNLVYAVKALVPDSTGLVKIGMPAEINFIPKSLDYLNKK